MKKPLSPTYSFTARKDSAQPGRVFAAARTYAPSRRVTLSVPAGLDARVKKSVVGLQSTAIVALAEWALLELERTGRSLEITNIE